MYDHLRDEIERAVEALHASPYLCWILEMGVCGHLLFDLWRMPGSSATILNYGLPYDRQVQINMLEGCVADSFASETHAIYLATYAYEQAFKVVSQEGRAGQSVVGVGITGAVTTDHERRGADRIHVAVCTSDGVYLVSVTLPKAKDQTHAKLHREEQGIFTDLIALNAILWAAGVEQVKIPGSINSLQAVPCGSQTGQTLTIIQPLDVTFRPDAIFNSVFWPNKTETSIASLDPKLFILFPGSFNPLTFAHVEMAKMVERMTGKRVIFQISQKHPDKAVDPLSETEFRRRMRQFSYRHPMLILPECGLYVEKARLFPGVQVLVGADAARNILDPRYYGGESGRRAMLEELDRLGSSFIVMGRTDPKTGRFEMRDDLDMPPRYAHLFQGVSARWDISSTMIRAQQRLT